MAGNHRHGQAGTSEYKTWALLKIKCRKRGLTLHDPWAQDFVKFFTDVGPRPTPAHRFERYPNRAGAYVPGNVRWWTNGDASDLGPPPKQSKYASLVGQRLGLLLVTELRRVRLGNGKVHCKAVCLCDCGRSVMRFCASLQKLQSCGCTKSHGLRTTGSSNYRFGGFQEIRAGHWSRYVEGAQARNLSFTISIEYAWSLFERQARRCALSGVPIKFTPRTAKKIGQTTASLDRIDSTKGYVEGNVQWVHKDINRMKGSMPEGAFLNWCRKVVSTTGGSSECE